MENVIRRIFCRPIKAKKKSTQKSEKQALSAESLVPNAERQSPIVGAVVPRVEEPVRKIEGTTQRVEEAVQRAEVVPSVERPAAPKAVAPRAEVVPSVEKPTAPRAVAPKPVAPRPAAPRVEVTVLRVEPKAEEAIPKVEAVVPMVSGAVQTAEELPTVEIPPPSVEETVERIKEASPKVEAVTAVAPGTKLEGGFVFRVRGIPSGVTKSDSEAALSRVFGTMGVTLDHTRITITPSCFGDGTSTALVQAKPHAQCALDKLGVGESHQVPLGIHNAMIRIDKDFYGLTQLYPTVGKIKAE